MRLSLASVSGFAPMMGKRVPTTGRTGDFDRAVNPVQRKSDDPRRIGLEGEFRQLEQVLDLGRELELLISTQ